MGEIETTGGGPGGYVAAIKAAQEGLKVNPSLQHTYNQFEEFRIADFC